MFGLLLDFRPNEMKKFKNNKEAIKSFDQNTFEWKETFFFDSILLFFLRAKSWAFKGHSSICWPANQKDPQRLMIVLESGVPPGHFSSPISVLHTFWPLKASRRQVQRTLVAGANCDGGPSAAKKVTGFSFCTIATKCGIHVKKVFTFHY